MFNSGVITILIIRSRCVLVKQADCGDRSLALLTTNSSSAKARRYCSSLPNFERSRDLMLCWILPKYKRLIWNRSSRSLFRIEEDGSLEMRRIAAFLSGRSIQPLYDHHDLKASRAMLGKVSYSVASGRPSSRSMSAAMPAFKPSTFIRNPSSTGPLL